MRRRGHCPYWGLAAHLNDTAGCEDPHCIYSGLPPEVSEDLAVNGDLKDVLAQLFQEAYMMDATTFVREAIKNTPQDYLEKTCTMRSDGPGRVGSYFPRMSAERVKAMLLELEWTPYTHEAIQAPAQGFIARRVVGRMGMVHIDNVPPETMLRLEDPKDTDGTPCGGCEAVWPNAMSSWGHGVDYVVALVGPDEGKEVLWTFFPGDPVKPSMVTRKQPCSHCDSDGLNRDENGLIEGVCFRCNGEKTEDLHGSSVNVERAKTLGVEWVKLG